MTPPVSTDPSADLRAYLAGTLSAERFAVVDAWLATLPEDEAARWLADHGGDADAGALRPAAEALLPDSTTGFASEMPRGRLRPGVRLGEGGMAVVETAHDRVLDRTVALKVLRPRQDGETLEHYHLREAAFRREAALTAGLEHPAIPPVYDVGREHGQPAFAMRRLDGRLLDAVISADDTTLAERVGILLRVAEAIGYAHSRGVVHRDLTPRNILVGAFGAVHVLDWGLATASGTRDGMQAGTPAWMAPEQGDGAAADPRMDVFGLGAVACAVLTGHGPRPDATDLHRLDLAPLAVLPPGLAALVRRCCAPDPAARYADGGAVADDLRRWLSDGVTLAQGATRWELAWLRLRRSPRTRAAALTGLGAALLALGAWQWSAWKTRTEAEARVARIAAGTALDRAESLAVALDEVRAIRQRQPALAAAQMLEARLATAHELAVQREHLERIRTRLTDLLHRTRTHGPWTDRDQAWRTAIRDAGLTLDGADADVPRLRTHALREPLLTALAFLWRADKERSADTDAARTAALLAAAGPTPGWQALGRLLGHSRFAAHDPVFCECDDAAGILTDHAATAVALALFAPEPRLAAAARASLARQPGDFWPLIAAGRASLADQDLATVERLALVASGAEPDSLLPQLLLAYTALQRDDPAALAQVVTHGLAIDPDNAELIALHAVVFARQGRTSEAQAQVDRLDPGHLQYHLHHAVGHPMERSVQAIVAAGLHIPDAPAELPTHAGHHQ